MHPNHEGVDVLYKVDWLSFTLPVEVQQGRGRHEIPSVVWSAVDGIDLRLGDWLGMETENTPSTSRAPYSLCWRFPDASLSIFASPRLSHILFEISGKGVDRLERIGHLSDVLRLSINRITRLDIATDILTSTRPLDFAAMRDVGRFKTHSEFVSPSGETCYIGSRSSERYARVYRYNPPHDRSHLLRVECSLKGINARMAAAGVLERGIEATAVALGNVFGWTHPDWSPDEDDGSTLRAYRPERHIGKTEFWLNSQVAPVLRRLHRENVLNVREWLDEYVLKGDDRE